jgi:WD40 repeat protein
LTEPAAELDNHVLIAPASSLRAWSNSVLPSQGSPMTPAHKYKLLVVGLGPLAVIAALLSIRQRGPGRRPAEVSPDLASTFRGHWMPVQALAFSPDGATLTSVAYFLGATLSGAEVAAWDVGAAPPTIKRMNHLDFRPYPDPVLALGGLRLAYADGRSLWRWDAAYPDERRLLVEHPCLVLSLAFAPDGGRLAVADFKGDMTLLDAVRGRPLAYGRGRAEMTMVLTFTADGTVLASGGQDGRVRLWDAATGEERENFRGHVSGILALAFSPDGRVLASGDSGGGLKLWDAATGGERATLATPGEEISALTFAPDGRTLAAAAGRVVLLWDVGTGERLAALEGHEGRVKCLAYSHDGNWLATGGFDRKVRLWDVTRNRSRTP